jgi:hypothetical protein
VAPCRSCVNRRFGEKYRLHLQYRKIRERVISVSRWLQTEQPVENTQLYKNRKGGRVHHAGSWLADFSTLRWRRYVSPKRRFTQDLQSATSHKTAFFIVTAMKTSYLTLPSTFF